MSRIVVAVMAFAIVGGACSPKTESKAEPLAAPIDAGIDAITTIGAYDPASGAHLDDDGSGAPAGRTRPARPGRPIEITLRSTPQGADAYVDGVKLGPTPAFWQGETDGRDHEFAFTMRGHATARYRFVPVASGVVHGRLEPVVTEPGVDAGVPTLHPSAKLQPPAPPPTLVSPPDAAVPKPAADAAPLAPDAAQATGSGPQP